MPTPLEITEFWRTNYVYFSRQKLKRALSLADRHKRDRGENGLIFSFKQQERTPTSIPMEILIVVNELDDLSRLDPVSAEAYAKIKGEKIPFLGGKPFFDLNADLYEVIFFPADQISRLLKDTKVVGLNFYGTMTTFKIIHPDFNSQVLFNIVVESTTTRGTIKDASAKFFIGHPCPPIWKS